MSAMAKRIYLVGLSGSGKSTVARLVAESLGWQAIDTDAQIEGAEGRSIAEIFASDGEEAFRALERKELAGAAALDNVVVATGGGAVIDADTRRAMAQNSCVVWLQARPETLAARLRDTGDERPLLNGDNDPVERLEQLMSERYDYYALADITIDVDGLDARQAAERIAALVREASATTRCAERLLLPEEHAQPPNDAPVMVEALSRRYAAHVGWGLLDGIGELIRDSGLSDAAFVVSDSDVLPRHGERVLRSLQAAGFTTDAFAIPAGEQHKRLETAATVYDWLVEKRAERGTAIVALGGGVIGDLAGFVAATYLRGLPLVQAPTSLLSMVDASIGGKVAVDHKDGKNLIGAFYQPRLVVADVSTLKTLPRRLLAEGSAEAIKHALILDPALLDDLEAHAGELLAVEPALTVDIVRRNVAIKAAIVAEDERDSGRRAILNYGHTVGHAIEAVSGYKIGHGAADAIGMMAAAEIGRRMELTPPQLVERQRAVFERYGLPTSTAGLSVDDVLAAITLDKKVADGAVNWVLLEDFGQAVQRADVPADLVRDVVTEVLS